MCKINKESMLFGFMLGDGWISYSKSNKQKVLQCGFSGDEKSLINVKNDLKDLYGNIGTARINTRHTESVKYNIYGTTTSMVVNLNVCKRYIELGMPIGKRVEKEFLLPNWITNGTRDVKANFISGLYAAEGFMPAMQKNDKTPKTLGFNMSKRIFLKNNFDVFAYQIEQILNELSIEYSISETLVFTCAENIKKTFIFSNSNSNILKLANILDLKYCISKKDELSVLKSYIEEKNRVLDVLSNAYEEAINSSATAKTIACKYYINERQIYNWRTRKTGIRIPNNFPTLTIFKQTYSPL